MVKHNNMKLNNIISECNNDLSETCRTLFEQSHCTKYIHPSPFPKLFIESTLDVLSENELSGISAMILAGVSKLQSAISPSTSSDLEALLAFMAPESGGAEAVKRLIKDASKSDVELSQNQEWWDNFFTTMNIIETPIQKDIQHQVADEVGQEMLRDPGLPDPMGSLDDIGDLDRERDSSNRSGGDLDDIRREKEEAEQYRQDLVDLISKGKQDREFAREKLNDIRNRLDVLAKSPVGEETINNICGLLIENDSVINNIDTITSVTLKKIKNNYNIGIPTIVENDTLNKIRALFANPKYASRQFQSSAITDQNIRAAKLAVRIATDHLQKKFSAKLQDSGLLPSDILKVYKKWSKLKKSGGNPNILSLLEKKLGQAFQLFNIDRGEQDFSPISDEPEEDPLNYDRKSNEDPLNYKETATDGTRGNIGADYDLPSSNIDGFKQYVARSIWNAAKNAAVKEGSSYKSVIRSAKRVAQKAYMINPDLAEEVWKVFVKWFRYQIINQSRP